MGYVSGRGRCMSIYVGPNPLNCTLKTGTLDYKLWLKKFLKKCVPSAPKESCCAPKTCAHRSPQSFPQLSPWSTATLLPLLPPALLVSCSAGCGSHPHVIAAASSPLNMEKAPLILHSSTETGHSHLIRHTDNGSQSRAQLKIAAKRCSSKAHASFAWLLGSIQTLGTGDTRLLGMPCASLWLRVLPKHPPA